MIRQSLDSFQLPACPTGDIMNEISRIHPAAPTRNKPMVPWGTSAAAAVLIFLLIGVGTPSLSHSQKPSNLSANADETKIATPESQWIQTKGPEGGTVVNLFATTTGDIYAGTAAGLYKFTVGQRAWQLITSEAPEAFTVYNEIGWWPMTAHRDTLYFATDTKVLASMDRGETWNVLGTHPKGLPIGIAITDRGLETDIAIYLALANGIFRSEDAGKSWAPLKNGLAGRKIRALVAVETTAFAGTDDGLYRLNAETWEQLSLTEMDRRGQKMPIQALAVTGHRLYAVVGKQFTNRVGTQVNATMTSDTWWNLYRSTDLGDTWYAVDPRKKLENKKVLRNGSVVQSSTSVILFENPQLASEIELKPSVKIFASGAKVVVTNGQNHYHSSDTGETWASLDLHNILGDRQHVVPPIVMLDANTFYIGDESGIHRTTDGGQSWHQFNTGLVSTDVTNLVAANGKLYAKITDGIVRSTDRGESWALLPIGIDNIIAIAEFDGNVYVEGEKKMVSRLFCLSADDDRLTHIPEIPAFEKVTPNEQVRLEKIVAEPFRDVLTAEAKQNFKVDEPLVLEDYAPGKLDTALTKLVDDLDAIIAIGRSGDFVVSDETYYVERQQKLFRWKPGATTWHKTGLISERKSDSGEDSDPFDFGTSLAGLKFAASGRTVYVGTRDGTLFQSFDEGNTWNDVTANLPSPISRFKRIAFAGATVYVTTDKGVIYSSDGRHWHATIDTDGARLVIDTLAVDGTTVYGIADVHMHPEQQVYQLKENSNTWKRVTPKIPNRVTSLAVNGNTLYVGTIGRGVLRFTLEE